MTRLAWRRLGRAAVVAAAVMYTAVAEARAQTEGTIVGLVLGGGETKQVWREESGAEPEGVRGMIAGAFADAGTPVAGLRFRAEGAYTQRGGDVVLESGGEPVRGGVRTDYLSVGVHVELTRSFGPVRVHVSGGPTLDQALSSELDPVLGQILEEESTVVFAVSIGTGLGVWVNDGLFVGADLRLTEGLGDAYSGSFTGFHNRTVEARLRAGVPLDRLRGG